MYYVIASKIVGYFMKRGCIKNEKRGQIIIEYTLSLLINILIASGIGHTLDMENQMVVFSIFYTLLRTSNGGNYLKLNTKSTVSLWAFAAAAILGMEYIVGNDFGNIMLMAGLALSFFVVIFFAPFKGKQFNVPEDVRKDLARRSKITICLECTCLAVGMWTLNSSLIAAAIVGVFIQSMSLLLMSGRQMQVVDLQVYGIS